MHNNALLSDKFSAALQICRRARRWASINSRENHMSLDDLFSGFVMIFGGGLAFLAWAGPAVVFSVFCTLLVSCSEPYDFSCDRSAPPL